jgi:hypothetical protein
VVARGVLGVALQLEGKEGVEIHMINWCHDAWEGGPLRNAVAALRQPCSGKRTRWGGGGGVAHGLAKEKVVRGGNFDTTATDGF